MEDKAARLGAALAFYSILSIGPLLVIAIAMAGLFFGHDAASRQIIEQIRGLIGNQGATAIEVVLQNSRNDSTGIYVTLMGIATLVLGATGFFGQLQDAMNTIWEVRSPPKQPIRRILKHRFFSFAMVLGVGFLLLVSLVISSVLVALGDFASGLIPEPIMQLFNFAANFVVTTMLFAMIFKVLPDVKISWHDVWLGAAITAILFVIGKYIIALYLGHSAISSSYGAAGSVIVVLIWVYYSAQILFLGAEFTQVYAKRRGSGIVPARGALPLTREMREEQNMPKHA
jgi:membrane protein